MDVVWLVKHQQIGDAFFDIDAASFLLEELKGTCQSEESPSTPADTARLSPRTEVARRQGLPGHAAGPRWMEALPRPSVGPGESGRAGVVVEYSEVLALEGGKGRDGLEGVTVILASGKVKGFQALPCLASMSAPPCTAWHSSVKRQ